MTGTKPSPEYTDFQAQSLYLIIFDISNIYHGIGIGVVASIAQCTSDKLAYISDMMFALWIQPLFEIHVFYLTEVQ